MYPNQTKYYKIALEKLGEPRIACTRLEAAGRRIAQQFCVQNAIDRASLESHTAPISGGFASINKLFGGQKQQELDYISQVLPYSGPALDTLVHSAESHPLKNATREDLNRLLASSNPSNLKKNLAKIANTSNFWASDWLKIITKLISTQNITMAQSITQNLMASGEKLPLGILAAAIEIARIRGHEDQFNLYAACCPIPRVPIPFPASQVQLVISAVRRHRKPEYAPKSPLHMRFFHGNWRQDPSFAWLLETLAKGYQKHDERDMLDNVVWWANNTRAMNFKIAQINLAAARKWNDQQRAWWTWQQVKGTGLENAILKKMARRSGGLPEQNEGGVPLKVVRVVPRHNEGVLRGESRGQLVPNS